MAQKKRGDRAPGKKWPKVKPRRLRLRIIAACRLRDVTPRQFAAEERLSRSTVNHYFKALEGEGWIYVSRQEPVSNGVRNWYRAKRPKIISDREFERMNEKERKETTEGVLMNYLDICKLALAEGTLDARPDSHLSHNLGYLDRESWDEIQQDLDLCLDRTLAKMVEAEKRLRESGEESIPTVIHLGSFEVPRSLIDGNDAPR